MASRSLNKVQLIGNLTRDPELRYTPSGAAVCTVGLATNRYWTTDAGERKEETEFHRLIAWNKLAEICSQYLVKGKKIYVEGRIHTNAWQAADGSQKTIVEIIIDDMMMLDSRRPMGAGEEGGAGKATGSHQTVAQPSVKPSTDDPVAAAATPPEGKEDVNPDDIPF